MERLRPSTGGGYRTELLTALNDVTGVENTDRRRRR
jgi:hypothetical protein